MAIYTGTADNDSIVGTEAGDDFHLEQGGEDIAIGQGGIDVFYFGAAFSGGELITVALENLIARYLGGRALNAVTSAERAHAEAQARQDVDQAIAEYCAARSDRDTIQLCTDPQR